MEALTTGPNPVCDLSGPTIHNYKGFIWQSSWGKCSDSTLDLMYSQCSADIKVLAVTDEGPSGLAISAFLVQVPQI